MTSAREGKAAVFRGRKTTKAADIVMTLEEAHALAARGKTRTDWDRVRRMTEEDVEAHALADPENPPWTEAMLARARWVAPHEKQAVSIRLDRDVLDFLKREGPGYQSRINAILRTYVDARKAG